MDVLYFFKERTRLIRQYYELAAQPFESIITKIEAEEEPYIPPYSEDPEPAFLSEWIEANEMIEITGRTCISMLSASLHLYFKTWEKELNLSCEANAKNIFKKKGFLAGYLACFQDILDIEWSDCPADLNIIEQVVLARNRDQHPEHITTMSIWHSDHFMKSYRMPFFLKDYEVELLKTDERNFFMLPTIHVSHDKLETAINQVEYLCEWLEEKMFSAKYPNARPAPA